VEEPHLVIVEGSSAIGILVAAVYATVIGSILWWMLHVPSVGDIETHISRIKREEERFAHIVVPVQGEVLSERLIALASQMARYRGATLDIVYVTEVPLTLPLSAMTEEESRRADQAFELAARIAARYDVRINKRVQKARQAGPAIVQYARENNADFVLMAGTATNGRRPSHYARSVEYVLAHALSEVIIDRPPLEA